MTGLRHLIFFLPFFLVCAHAEPECESLVTGKPAKIVITDKAMNHIWNGDFGQDPVSKKQWIKGGMHSFSALDGFLQRRPDIYALGAQMVDLRIGHENVGQWFNINVNPENGVGTVRLPPSAYSKNSLFGLYLTDVHAQGGFLWKTLFPRDMTQAELEDNIRTLFDQQTEYEDRGHALLLEGVVTRSSGSSYRLKILVSKNDGRLISAYPTYSQPKGIQGPTPVQRSLMIVDLAPSLSVTENNRPFSQAMADFVSIEIHSHSVWKPRNYKKWNALSAGRRRQIMDFMLAEGLHVNGSLSMVELLAQMAVDGYEPESFMKKSMEVVGAVVQDNDLSVHEKLIFLLNLVSNQRVYGSRPLEDIIVGKYLLAETYKLVRQSDLGIQKYAVRVIEGSPIYFLNLIPFRKGLANPKADLIVRLARVADALAIGANVWRDEQAYPVETSEWYFELAGIAEETEWAYFQILHEIESHSPGFVTQKLPRIKYLSDFVNIQSLRLTTAEITQRWGSYQVSAFGQNVDSGNVIDSKSKSRLMRRFRQNAKLISELLFQDRDQFNEWYRMIDIVSSGSVARLKTFAKDHDYWVTEEGYDIVERPVSAENQWTVPHVEVHVIPESKSGPLIIKSMLAQYTMSFPLRNNQ